MQNPYSQGENEIPGIDANFKRNRISAKKAGIGTVNAGGAIVLIIFVVLCLAIFGILSFATSFADKKLADKNLSSVSQYYAADSSAEEKLAEIYGAIYAKLNDGSDVSFGASFVSSATAGISGDIKARSPKREAATDENIQVAEVSYRTKISSGAAGEKKVEFFLDSGISFYYNKNTNKLSYRIFEWKVTMESDLEYDDEQIDVWDGNF